MIKLEKGNKPQELTDELVAEQTQIFKDSLKTPQIKSVWNIKWLKDSLSSTSHGKCAYCEVSLKKESNYLEVEHFEDKSHNPNKVLEWENLLPSCKHCNVNKSTHNVIAEPIINPYVDIPSMHIFLRDYMMRARDIKGKTTIEVLGLKDYERIIEPWFNIGQTIEERINKIECKFESFIENKTVRRRNSLRTDILNLLNICQPSEEYSAVCSTILVENEEMQKIKKELEKMGLWEDDLKRKWEKCEEIALLK